MMQYYIKATFYPQLARHSQVKDEVLRITCNEKDASSETDWVYFTILSTITWSIQGYLGL